MSAVALRPDAERRGGPSSGTAAMVRLHLRTSWRGLLGWPVAIAVALGGTAAGVGGLYAEAEDRAVYAATVGDSPATVAFNGAPLDLGTIGGIAAFEGGFFALLLIPMIAVHLAIAHTRRPEEAGLAELVTAARVGRMAPLLSGAVVVGLALALAGALTWAGMAAAGVAVEGAALYSAGVLGLTLVFAAVGLVAAELAQTARSAYLIGVTVVSATFGARAAVDVTLLPDDVVEGLWATPMGWMSAIRPFGDPAAWPFAALLATTAVALGAAIWVRGRRDLGAGVVAERRGPARGDVRTVRGLAWRLLRTAAIAWVVGATVAGSAFGLLAREVRVLTESNPALAEVIGGAATDNLMGFGLVLVALLAAAAAAQSIGRLVQEEGAGRTGLVLATATTRMRWWAVLASLPTGIALVALLSGGAGLGVGAWVSDGDVASVGTALSAALWYLPALAAVVGLSAVGATAGARSLPVGWVVGGWAPAVAFLGDAMDLPPWARDLSVLDHVGLVPAEDGAPTAAALLAALGVGLTAVSAWRFARRDLRAG